MPESAAARQTFGRGYTEQELRRTDLPVTSYVCGIPLYPVGGTVYLYGPPGIGKSFVTQGLNHTITWGKRLGSFTVDPLYTSNVLYCDFESTPGMVRERSLLLTPHGQLASDTGGADMETDTTYIFAEDWRGKSFPERLAELEQRLWEQENNRIGYSLVVLDTYTKFVGPTPPLANSYEYDTQVMDALNALAWKYQVCILLITHPNKAGSMTGSTGRAGGAWIQMGFHKTGETQAALKMTKNRVDRELTLIFDQDADNIWRLSTSVTPKVALAKGNNRVLLELLAKHGAMTKAELIKSMGRYPMPEGSLKSALGRLQARGDVELLPDRRWRVTFATQQEMPAMTAWRAVKECRACGVPIDPQRGCADPACSNHFPEYWKPATESQLRTEDPQRPGPKWKQMAAKGPREVELVQIDASSKVIDGEKVWNVSPITTAIDLIMADRDAGRLSPTWRCDLPKAITDPLDGHHRWGPVPARYMGQLRKAPEGEWHSYDVRGSFLASYKTALAIKPLPQPVESDGREWTRKHAGALEILMPQWVNSRLGHPAGVKARPGQWQWVWSPTYRLLTDLAEAGQIERPQVRRTALRSGYQGASEALLEGFYNRMRVAREHYTGEELLYVKEMYSAFLSTTRHGKSNVFDREDWFYSIRSEAFGRLWRAGWDAVKAGVEVLAMGNTDEIVLRPCEALAQLWPVEGERVDRRIGKMTFKEAGNGLAR